MRALLWLFALVFWLMCMGSILAIVGVILWWLNPNKLEDEDWEKIYAESEL